MTIYNSGTLTPNRCFTNDEMREIFKILLHSSNIMITYDSITFCDEMGTDWDNEINQAIDYLNTRGVTLEGTIVYTGDYEGAYLVEPGEKCKLLSSDEYAVREADASALIHELERRGYTVTKN